jgi:hypothetical protein
MVARYTVSIVTAKLSTFVGYSTNVLTPLSISRIALRIDKPYFPLKSWLFVVLK